MSERIVVLDGFTTNPGDLDWSPLAKFGALEAYDRTPDAEVVTRVGDAPYVLLNKAAMTGRTITALPALRYIGVLATGYNTVDLAAAKSAGITVTNVPQYATQSVAEHAAAMMLDLAHGITLHVEAVRAGDWSRSPDWCFTRRPVFELRGKTLGLVGFGRIGAAFAAIAAALGLRLIVSDPALRAAPSAGGAEVALVSLDRLFETADIVSLHCPLTPQTHHLVNAARLARMKPGALIINTSRGPLIDEAALAAALRAGTIAGAAVDVLEEEPPALSNLLIGAPNCLVTPHIAWQAAEARRRLIEAAAENLAAFQAGDPRNVVS